MSSRVRPQSRWNKKPNKKPNPPERKFKRILTLPFYDELYEKLCGGWSLAELARDIQARGFNQDIKQGQVRNILRAYRDEMIPDTALATSAIPRADQRDVAKVEEGLRVLDELERLYRLQSRRLSIEVVEEEANRQLRGGTVREMKEAREILQTYHKVQSDMGLVVRKLGELEVTGGSNVVVAQQFGEAAARLTSKKKNVTNVLDVFRKVLQLDGVSTDVPAAAVDDDDDDVPDDALVDTAAIIDSAGDDNDL